MLMIMMSLAAEDPSLASSLPLPTGRQSVAAPEGARKAKLKMISSAVGDNRTHIFIFTLQVKEMDVTKSRVRRLTID